MPLQTTKYYLLILLALSVPIAQAQYILNIKQSTGTNTQYYLTNVRKITFGAGNMTVIKTDATTKVVALNVIQNLFFTSNISAVPELKTYSVNKLTIYPTSVSEQLIVSFASDVAEKVQFQILDLQGKLYIQQVWNCQLGTNIKNVSVLELPKGLYICRLINSKAIATNKFIKL
ncbi:MAG: T9SS type A sorting domain-containing protein [Paludibacter sp.]